jgi:hypothetical protein
MELHVNTFKIGCDPEFALRNKTTKALMCVPSESRLHGGNKVGVDHGGAVVELRPDPSYRVLDLLRNIKSLLKNDELMKLKDYEWKAGGVIRTAGGYFQGMGGHVHLELPYQGHHGVDAAVYNLRVKACDAVTKHLEELDILPREECRIRRSDEGGGWGRFGSVQFGSVQVAVGPQSNTMTPFYRMEYRTPCSWLFDPKAAFITLTGIKLAATMPELAISTLKGNSTEEKWGNLVKFFRTFQHIDSDAEFACKRLLKSSNPKCLKPLQVNPDCDFKGRWDKFKYV